MDALCLVLLIYTRPSSTPEKLCRCGPSLFTESPDFASASAHDQTREPSPRARLEESNGPSGERSEPLCRLRSATRFDCHVPVTERTAVHSRNCRP